MIDTGKAPHEDEIRRDIPLLHKNIARCETSIRDFRADISKQRLSILEYQGLIDQDRSRVADGKRPRYEEASMLANIAQFQKNITLLESKIEQEEETAKRMAGYIGVLEEDLKRRPQEIVIDLRQLPQRRT